MRIFSFDQWCASQNASVASRSFSTSVRRSCAPGSAFLTNCCSIVEAPCTAPPCTTSATAARASERRSIPLLVMKRLSSIEITASRTIGGICRWVTSTWSRSLSIPISVPRSSSSTELRALSWR